MNASADGARLAADRPPLGHARIEALIPHHGAMCLLETMTDCDTGTVRCLATDHRDPAHPLRDAQGLPAAAALEIASQAMALHGALNSAPGTVPRVGFLASVRELRLLVARLDDAAGPLVVQATLLAGDAKQAMYRFELDDAGGRRLVDGRATVILEGELALAATAAGQT
jgi:predicted hotdog family 3-hydroxylacyl-ACP dehydratase